MALRIGFEIEGAGLAGVGLIAGFLAAEETGAPRERHLFHLVHLGAQGPALGYGFLETVSRRGVRLPHQGDIGTAPIAATLGNRMVRIAIQSGWGYHVAATLAIEIGPSYGRSGDPVYKKEGFGVWVNNIAMGNIDFTGRLDRLQMNAVYFDTVSGHPRSAGDIWNAVMERV
jgi:hypothetical protein